MMRSRGLTAAGVDSILRHCNFATRHGNVARIVIIRADIRMMASETFMENMRSVALMR